MEHSNDFDFVSETLRNFFLLTDKDLARLMKEAEDGSNGAAVQVAQYFFSRGDRKQAKEWYEHAVKLSNDTTALYMLGIIWRKEGLANDDEEALIKAKNYFEKAVDADWQFGVQSNVYNIELGKCYLYEQGTKGEQDKAYSCFIKVDPDTYPEVNFYLGVCCMYGLGTDEDRERAYNYFIEVDRNEAPMTSFYLGQLILEGYGEDINDAFEYLNEAYDNGIIAAKINLGYCYAHGIGTEEDPIAAYECFKEVADRTGDMAALFDCGVCYLQGVGVAQSSENAQKMFQLAADQGDPQAQHLLDNWSQIAPDYEFDEEYEDDEGDEGDETLVEVQSEPEISFVGFDPDAALRVAMWYEIQRLTQDNKRLTNENASKEAENKILKAENKSLKDEKASKDEQIAQLKKENNLLGQKVEKGISEVNEKLDSFGENAELNHKEISEVKEMVGNVGENIELSLNVFQESIENRIDNSTVKIMKNDDQNTEFLAENVDSSTNQIIDNSNKNRDMILGAIRDTAKKVTDGLDDLLSEFKGITPTEQMLSDFINKAAERFNSELQSHDLSSAREELSNRFGDTWNKLEKISQKSLVSAWSMWKSYQYSDSDDDDHGYDYRGVVICAAAALENELKRYLFDDFFMYVAPTAAAKFISTRKKGGNIVPDLQVDFGISPNAVTKQSAVLKPFSFNKSEFITDLEAVFTDERSFSLGSTSFLFNGTINNKFKGADQNKAFCALLEEYLGKIMMPDIRNKIKIKESQGDVNPKTFSSCFNRFIVTGSNSKSVFKLKYNEYAENSLIGNISNFADELRNISAHSGENVPKKKAEKCLAMITDIDGKKNINPTTLLVQLHMLLNKQSHK